jgi:hypothetical protein
LTTHRGTTGATAVPLPTRKGCEAAAAAALLGCLHTTQLSALPSAGRPGVGLLRPGQPAHSYAPHHFEASWPVDCRSTACWELLTQQLLHNCTLQQTTTTAQGAEPSANTAAALAQRPKQANPGNGASRQACTMPPTYAHVRHDINSHKQQQHTSTYARCHSPDMCPDCEARALAGESKLTAAGAAGRSRHPRQAVCWRLTLPHALDLQHTQCHHHTSHKPHPYAQHPRRYCHDL